MQTYVGHALGAWWRAAVAVAATVAAGAATLPGAPAGVAAPVPTAAPPHQSAWQTDIGTGSKADQSTLWDLRKEIQMGWGASASLTGTGVGIALIDTGVAPVPGLRASRVVNGPDLSFESQVSNLRYLDTYGHGTHMAGIMVGDDPDTGDRGLAPGAKLTSIKVGTYDGTVDVSQVLAAIDWVVQHKNDDPAYPIRVINLSYATGGNPASLWDPVQFAAEQAWKAGIVVVAAAGNGGKTLLSDPASDPFILSVGSAKTNGTGQNSDDTLSTFNNGKTAARRFDILAPGESIVSLRDPGSYIDQKYPGARVGATLFRGSGTSQSAAVASAAVAVLLQARPSLTPAQVRQLLMNTGTSITGTTAKMINVNAALAGATPSGTQTGTWSYGTGNLDEARGQDHVVVNGVPLYCENTILGPFYVYDWADRSARHVAWNGGLWMDYRFAGYGWNGTSWASKTWGAATWPGTNWASASWSDSAFVGRYWSGGGWTGGTWSGRYWSGSDWTSQSYS